MSCRLRQLAVFLLLGVCLNAALAMGFICFGRVMEAKARVHGFREVEYFRLDSIGMTCLSWTPVGGSGGIAQPARPPGWSQIHRLARPLPKPAVDDMSRPLAPMHFEFAAGWPRRSLTYSYEHRYDAQLRARLVVRSGIDLPTDYAGGGWQLGPQPRAIPLRIVPTGFAINTLLFGSLAAVVWHGLRAVRSGQRQRRHQCPMCGYKRVGLAAVARCPECGTG